MDEALKLDGIQNELLQVLETFVTNQTIRMRKLEVDQSNLNTSLRGRVETLEARLLQIEQRLASALLT